MLNIALLIGAPQSGKSVVSSVMRDNCGASVLQTKELLEKHSPTGVSSTIIGGGVVCDDIMIPILDLEWPERSDLVVIDSLRSVDQVLWVREKFPEARILTLHLTVDENLIWRRLKEAPKTERGVRPDDNPETLRKRLKAYTLYSPPMFPVLRRVSHSFEEVDTNRGVHATANQVLRFCDKHKIPTNVGSCDPVPNPFGAVAQTA